MAEAPPPRTTRRREVVGYCLYDFANSSYTTLISTVAFSVYFSQAVVWDTGIHGDRLWSQTTALAHAILILISPVIGAIADGSGRKKRFLLLSTVVTVVATAGLFFVEPGAVTTGIVLFVIGTVGFEAGYIFYNAFLPEVSTPRTIGRVSGWSWGTGFLGGLCALVACLPFLHRPLVDRGLLDGEAVDSYRLSFVIVALFFALFSIPTFLFLRERGIPAERLGVLQYVQVGFRRVYETFLRLRDYRAVALYMAAVLFFYGGIETVIKFSAIYASQTFGIRGKDLLLLFVFTNLIAAPGTLAAGYAADRVGSRRALAITLAGWILLLAFGASVTRPGGFVVMAAGIAIGMGATQAIGRSFMSQISPPDRRAEFFGFYLLCSKAGAVLSLLLFGWISSSTGSQRIAVLGVIPFFVAGLTLLLLVRPAAATRPS